MKVIDLCHQTVIVVSLLTCIAVANSPQTIIQESNSLHACSLLNFQLPGLVSFPGDDVYKGETRSYWASNLGELTATCRVTPRKSTDVQKTMYLISRTNATFAIRSGGHAVVANTSNVADGVVIDLRLLNHVLYRPELGILDVGAGARWADVYRELDQYSSNLQVVGGRAGAVGVGGFLLGGGLSFHSGTHGWGCDQVQFFETVLANGTVIEASLKSEPDLFKVLKGGGSNFGVVTRFGLTVIETPKFVDILTLQYDWRHIDDVVYALDAYIRAPDDPKALVSITVSTEFKGSMQAITVMLSHQDDVLESKAFSSFFNITHQITLHKRMSQRNSAILFDEWNPSGFRQVRTTTTFYNDAQTLIDIAQNFSSLADVFSQNLGGDQFRSGILMQPLTRSRVSSVINGGNIIGLENETSDLAMLSIELRYSNEANDNKAATFVSTILTGADQEASRRGIAHSFRYLNAASDGQSPFQHIKERTDAHSPWPTVLAAKAKYDPHNVFGRQIHDPFRI